MNTEKVATTNAQLKRRTPTTHLPVKRKRTILGTVYLVESVLVVQSEPNRPIFPVGDTVTAEDLLVGNNAEIEGTLCPGGKKYDGFFQVV
ncbi:MAG: hypothetical protein EXS11_10420 [Gemmataceae bacterium]|nr:hypothetical protein [Gemmataceae bacterium]